MTNHNINGKVYVITNRVNNKKYVGVTTKTINRRFEEHTKTDSYIGNAIRKHGRENFDISLLDVADTERELFEKEIEWIEKLETYGKGYNLTNGGEGGATKKKIKINLTDTQKRFCKRVEEDNKKEFDINDTKQILETILHNAAYLFLIAEYKDEKTSVAKTISRFDEGCQNLIYNLGVLEKREFESYI